MRKIVTMPSSRAVDPVDDTRLGVCSAVEAAIPSYYRRNLAKGFVPILAAGVAARSPLLAVWNNPSGEYENLGDLTHVHIVTHRGGGRIWRDRESVAAEAGAVSMQPFQASRFRFEHEARYAVASIPFSVVRDVCESLFDRELTHEQLWIPMGTKDPNLASLMQRMLSVVAIDEPSRLLLDCWALMLADVMVRQFSSHATRCAPPSFGTIPERNIAHVIEFIETNLDQNVTLASMARVAAMGVYHFARRFKATVGISPHAYLLERRIRRAQRMLGRTPMAIADVAAACGFSSQAYFTTAFQRRLGVTPGSFRRSVSS